jgi:hypothetical protein
MASSLFRAATRRRHHGAQLCYAVFGRVLLVAALKARRAGPFKLDQVVVIASPTLLIALGTTDVFSKIAVFFSKMAVVLTARPRSAFNRPATTGDFALIGSEVVDVVRTPR